MHIFDTAVYFRYTKPTQCVTNGTFPDTVKVLFLTSLGGRGPEFGGYHFPNTTLYGKFKTVQKSAVW
jgi:hypothetical protein